MAMSYSTATRTARMQAVIDKIDGGAGAGTLEIGTTAFASTLAVLSLSDPCGTAASGVLTFDVTPVIEDTSANNSGTAAAARIKDSDGNIIVDGLTVGTSGTHIVLVSTTITAGEPVQITSFTITEGNA